MNYYQDCNQPLINEKEEVIVFSTVEELLESIGNEGFRCPNCNGVSKSPYNCSSGIEIDSKVCDWKSYGLFGTLGKGISVFVIEKVVIDHLFMPIAWEEKMASIKYKHTFDPLYSKDYLESIGVVYV